MLRTLLAAILALALSTAGAQIVNRPVAAGSISNPGTSLPATCAVGYVYFKSNSTAGQNLHLCTAANTWTQMTGGNLANPVTPGQGGSGVANSKNLTWSNSLTLAGTDATTMTFPSTSATIARTDAANTFSGTQTFSGTITSTNTGTVAFNSQSATTGAQQMFMSNTTGGIGVGMEDTPSGTLIVGSTAYDAVVYSKQGNLDFSVNNGTNMHLQLAPTGLLSKAYSTNANQFRVNQATVPTCSTNCGTSPSIVGSDTAGVVTMGASGVPASAWVVTFQGTWAAAPSCIVQSALSSMVVGKMPIAVVTSTTTMTVTTNGTAPSTSDKYQYHCIGTS